MDNYIKKCLSLLVGKSFKGGDVQQELSNVALCEEATPEKIQCDNGSEFIFKEVDRCGYEHKVTLDFSRPGNRLTILMLNHLTVSLETNAFRSIGS